MLKKGKIFKHLGKNVQNLKKKIEKGQVIACDYHTQWTVKRGPAWTKNIWISNSNS